MASAALIAVLVVLIVLTLASVEVTMYIIHRRRHRRNRIPEMSHKKHTPWSTLGIASTVRSRVLDIVEAPQPPLPSHSSPRPDRGSYQVLDRPVTSAGVSTLNPYTPPPLPPIIPRLPLPAPLVMSWPNEKERLETVSLGSVTRPPSYSQVDASPLSPRYTLIMRGQWPSPVSPSSPSLVPPIPEIRVHAASSSPSDSRAQRISPVDVSSTDTAHAVSGAATSV